VIPPKANAAFVAAMEDVLDVYTRPHDPARPLVCLDETSKQLIAETRAPEPMQPGQPARHDYEYKRNGTANLFMLFAPLEGWRHVEVTERRTAIDYAKILRDLSDIHFPKAEKIVLMQDNLNTHAPASLYEAFEPVEARRIIERFEWHYTPQARQLAQSGRVRVGRSLRPVPRPPYPRRRHPQERGRRLAHESQHPQRQGQLALHHRRRACEIEEPVSLALGDSGH
jgi:DDE superfamily endonuclease